MQGKRLPITEVLAQLIETDLMRWLAMAGLLGLLLGTQAWISRAEAAERAERATVTAQALQAADRESQRRTILEKAVQTGNQLGQKEEAVAEQVRNRFAAQVVGLQWLNPLQRRDYPTEWQLLWTLGLAKPNADDDVVPKKPEKYSKVGKVGAIAFNTRGDQSFDGYYETYIDEIFGKLWERYFMDKNYFYSVAKGRKPWREVAGIRVEMTLPQRLDAEESRSFVQRQIASYFAIGRIDHSTGTLDKELTTSSELPHIDLKRGGPVAGFSSYEAALDYLEEHPDKTVWLLAFDAPSFPLDGQLNETGALLVLAHPDYQTGREPLAWIHRSSRVPVVKGAIASAWKTALVGSASRGSLKTDGIGYLIHDAGQGSDLSSKRLGDLARGATESLDGFEFATQSFNTTALLGDLNAGTAATNLALAIAYAHHKNVPVIVAGTRESAEGKVEDRAVTTILVRPPAHPTPFDPNKNWFRARGEGNAYLPWWSRRLDAEPKRMQGWSD
jgi:hypothetical protein